MDEELALSTPLPGSSPSAIEHNASGRGCPIGSRREGIARSSSSIPLSTVSPVRAAPYRRMDSGGATGASRLSCEGGGPSTDGANVNFWIYPHT